MRRLNCFIMLFCLSWTKNPTADESLPAVNTKILKPANPKRTRELPAIIKANIEAKLAFRIDGPLQILNCQPGMRFAKGDVLAMLDPRDFILRMERVRAGIEEAKATLKAMLSGARTEDINALNSQLDGAISQMKEAEANNERIIKLYEQGVVTKAQQESAQTAFEVGAARVAALREEMQKALSGSRAEEVEAMNARIRGMEAEFEAAKNALHDSRLVAPFNGLVAERYVENYEIVKAGQPVALFIDLSAIRVRAALPEELLLKQNEIKKATLRFPGGNEQNLFTDHLEFSQQSAPANLVWFLDAIVELPEKSPLRPGMSAFMDIEFLPDPDRTLFIIPHRSVFSHDLNSAAVFIYEPDCRCARLRTVKTGFLRSGGLEVTEGLKAGENLITNGFARLFDGCKVKINQ